MIESAPGLVKGENEHREKAKWFLSRSPWDWKYLPDFLRSFGLENRSPSNNPGDAQSN